MGYCLIIEATACILYELITLDILFKGKTEGD